LSTGRVYENASAAPPFSRAFLIAGNCWVLDRGCEDPAKGVAPGFDDFRKLKLKKYFDAIWKGSKWKDRFRFHIDYAEARAKEKAEMGIK
jgi:hypothetical protein